MSELYDNDDDTDFDEMFGDLNFTMLHSGGKHLVFVYGTLMDGQRNHKRLQDFGAKLYSPSASISGDFKMRPRRTGLKYLAPVVVRGKPGETKGLVRGEIYEISNQALLTLDVFEGHPEVYRREKLDVSFVDYGALTTIPIWVYIFTDDDYQDGELLTTDYHAVAKTTITGGFTAYRWLGEVL